MQWGKKRKEELKLLFSEDMITYKEKSNIPTRELFKVINEFSSADGYSQ